MLKDQHGTWRSTAERLQRELIALKERPPIQDETIQYLLDSAENFIKAADTLIGIREQKDSASSEQSST